MKELALSVKNFSLLHKDKEILGSIDFDLLESEVLCVVGPKHSGQDLLLLGLLGDLQGAVVQGEIRGVSTYRWGYVSSSLSCVDSLTVFQNLSLVLKFVGVESQAQLGESVESALRVVDLWGELKSYLHQSVSVLSEFQKIRLNLARTLILRPKILLLDDPTLDLDPVEKCHYENIINGLRDLVTVIWVTFDLEQAARVSDKILFLKEGKMIEVGATEDLFTLPTKIETEKFLSHRLL